MSRFDEAVLDMIGGSLRLGSLSVLLPDGRERTYRGAAPGPDARLEVRDWRGVRGIVREGSIGLAEGWMAEELDTPDLPTLIELAAHHLEPENRRVPEAVDRLGKAAWRAIGRAGRLRGPLRTMAEHYDLGNRFFALWLDETMTYSSAYFARDDMTLAEAQREKYRRLAERAAIAPGMRVLETGCGWGSFAVYLATELGCTVTTTTISREQAEHVKTRVGDLGLGDRVQVLLEDFADTTGRFDAIVSVEMIESIPGARWPAYFRALRDRLEPGGRVGLQSIVVGDQHWRSSDGNPDFVRRYIFPGGQVPAPSVLRQRAGEVGLRWREDAWFGRSYARTLATWHRNFDAAWPEIAALGFDRRFQRMWQYYLSYTEGGFRCGHADVGQIVLEG